MLKLKDGMPSLDANDVRSRHNMMTSQDRNLAKNHVGQNHGKSVHKELIRKDKSANRQRKKTSNGLYTGKNSSSLYLSEKC